MHIKCKTNSYHQKYGRDGQKYDSHAQIVNDENEGEQKKIVV